MIKVTELSENEIEEIGEAFADYNYADGEKGMTFLYNGRDSVKEYICGYVRAMLAGGCLFSTSDKHEAFVAYKFSKDKLPASAGFILLKTVFRTLGFKGAVNMLSAIKKGGESYETTLKKQKKPYIFVGMLVVRKQYQCQGFMRKALDIAFDEGRKRGVPVLLETDAALKRDKYVHLGMKNMRTRKRISVRPCERKLNISSVLQSACAGIP